MKHGLQREAVIIGQLLRSISVAAEGETLEILPFQVISD